MSSEGFDSRIDDICAAYDIRNESPENLEAYKLLMYEQIKRLISVLAKKWSGIGKGNVLATANDLAQDAVVALMKGLDKYNPHISLPSTYFVPRLEREMKEKANLYPIKTTDYYQDAIAEVDQELREYGYKEGIRDSQVTIDLLVDVMSIPVKKARTIYDISRRDYQTLEDASYIENKQDPTPEEALLEKEQTSWLIEQCDKLLPLEKYIINRKINDDMSYRSIVSDIRRSPDLLKEFSLEKKQVTGTFVKQIESGAYRKLRGRQNHTPERVEFSAYQQADDEDIYTAVIDKSILL